MKTLEVLWFGTATILLTALASRGETKVVAVPEIDVISGSATEATQTVAAAIPPLLIKSADGKCDITIDTSGATDLKEWAETKLAPVLAEWFPKIVAMLPSEGYTPPAVPEPAETADLRVLA